MIPSQQILDISKSIQTDSDLMFGLICTGDKFVSTPAEIAFIRSYFPDVKAVDMESAAIAQVCMMTGTPFWNCARCERHSGRRRKHFSIQKFLVGSA